MYRSSNIQSTLLVMRKLALDSLVIAPSRNNIEHEVLLQLADEYRPTCSIFMTNPGSLTRRFSEADPRQLDTNDQTSDKQSNAEQRDYVVSVTVSKSN